MGLTVKSQRPLLTWMASKRLGEYIIFPFHRTQGHNKAEAREARMETLVNRILFKTGAYGLAKVHTQLLLSFSAFFLKFKLRDKFNSTAKKSLELVSGVHVHVGGALGGHVHVEVNPGALSSGAIHLVLFCFPRSDRSLPWN